MKKITIILFLLVIPSAVRAQGNLEFSRAIKQSGAVVSLSGSSIIVPSNKILKITSGSIFTNTAFCTLLIDSHIIGYYLSSTSASNYQLTCNLPIWLPQGTYQISFNSPNTVTSGYYSYSGIEFNIVP